MFDLGEMFKVGIGVMNFFQRKKELQQERAFQQGMEDVFKSQREVNDKIGAFNLDQRIKDAKSKSSALATAMASAGLTGGTLADDAKAYERALLISALSPATISDGK